MSKLNKKGAVRAPKFNAVSYNGNPQYSKDAAQQLYETIVMTLYGKDSFYESNDDRLVRLEQNLQSVVSDNKLDFVANAILHARHVMNIRTMPLILTVLFAKVLREQEKQYPNMRRLVTDVIARADQITDMYAMALQVFGDKKLIPMAIKRGVADAFNKFNEYQFAKYSSSASVKLRDVLRIVHPAGKDEHQGVLFKKIMEDALSTPYTWETQLSGNGQKGGEQKSKKDIWTDLITSGKVGYMALLRNIRNMLEADVDSKVFDLVLKRIADPKEVAKSKQFPFRFVNAYEHTKQFGKTKLTTAIAKAIDHSLGNLPKLGDGVWIIIDCSCSMNGHSCGMDEKLKAGPVPIKMAALLAAALAKASGDAENVAVTLFSNHAAHVNVNTQDSVLSISEHIMKKVYGGGTNLQAALDMKNTLGFEPDTVIVLSDMQVDMLTSTNVAKLFKKDCVKIAINLEAYGSTPLPTSQGWIQLAGYTDKIFQFIPAMRKKETIETIFDKPYIGADQIRNVASVEEDDVE